MPARRSDDPKQTITIRLEASVIAWMRETAGQNNMSVNEFMRWLMKLGELQLERGMLPGEYTMRRASEAATQHQKPFKVTRSFGHKAGEDADLDRSPEGV